MVFQKFRVWLGQHIGSSNDLTFKGREVLFERGLWEMLSQSRAEDYTERFIQRDQPVVEGGIVQTGEAKAVARIESVFGECAPRADVTSDQEARNGNAADAAADSISVEYRLSEKLLPAPQLHHAQFFGRTRGGNARRSFEVYAVALKEIDLFGFVVCEKIVEQCFAFGRQCREVYAKLRPHRAILFRGAVKAFDPTCGEHGIEGGEVAQFHRDIYDERVALVQLSEGKFAVEIQRDEEVLTGPFDGGRFGHAADVGDLWGVSEASLLDFPKAPNLARWINPSWAKL